MRLNLKPRRVSWEPIHGLLLQLVNARGGAVIY
jgi:hypothetical protein